MDADVVVCAEAPRPEAGDGAEVPVAGTVGTGKVERLFCALAHEYLRGEAGEVEYCSQAKRLISALADSVMLCGLTAHEHVCLFEVPQDPQWKRIRELMDQQADASAPGTEDREAEAASS